MNDIKKLSKTSFEKCKKTCKVTYNELDHTQQKHMDQLIESGIELFERYKPFIPLVVEKAKNMSLLELTNIVTFCTKFLQKKQVVSMIEHYLFIYEDVLNNKKRLASYTKYSKCLIDQLDPNLCRFINACIILVKVIISLILNQNIKPKIKKIINNVHSQIVKPVHRSVKKKLKEHKP